MYREVPPGGTMITVGARLWLINALLAVAIIVVIGQSWYTLDRHQAAADRLSTLRLAQHYHRGVLATHQGAQSQVDSSLRARELGMPSRAGSNSEFRARLDKVRGLLEEMRRLPLPEAIRAGHQRLQSRAEQYGATANQVVLMSERDLAAALRQAPKAGRDFDALNTEMQAQSALIDTHLAAAENELQAEQHRTKRRLAVIGAGVILAACGIVLLIARSLRRSLHEVSSVARRIAAGEFGVRAPVPARDELGELGDAINSMAQSLEGMIARLSAKAQEDAFINELDDAFEMADTEAQACTMVAQAMKTIDAAAPMELLLADADRTRLSRAVRHPAAGAAACDVSAPSECIAVRRGRVQVFPDSEALNACPRLRGRAAGALSAVCVPVSFMGRSLGVLHATGAHGTPLETARIERLGALGMQAGARIGTLRSIRRTQQQADTDALTGLLNRRATERMVEEFRSAGRGYALIMADIDYFKRLNDTQGHDAGDRALRAFAELLRRGAGAGAVLARWGGEEFLLVLPGADATGAYAVAEALRTELEGGALPGCQPFTASFGVADSDMATGFEAALTLADAALYRAKESGRNRVAIASGGRPAPAAAAASDTAGEGFVAAGARSGALGEGTGPAGERTGGTGVGTIPTPG